MFLFFFLVVTLFTMNYVCFSSFFFFHWGNLMEKIMHNFIKYKNAKYYFLLLLILWWKMTRACSGFVGEIQPCSRMHFCQCIHVQLYRCVHVHENTCMLVLCLCGNESVCLSERDWDFNTCLILVACTGLLNCSAIKPVHLVRIYFI